MFYCKVLQNDYSLKKYSENMKKKRYTLSLTEKLKIYSGLDGRLDAQEHLTRGLLLRWGHIHVTS